MPSPVFSNMKKHTIPGKYADLSTDKHVIEKTHQTKQNRLNWLCAVVLLGATGSLAAQTTAGPPNNYLVHNLVSDLANTADHQDPNLVNPWGNGFGASPFW